MEYIKKIYNYFDMIQEKINQNKEAKERNKKKLAPDFNSFDFWSIDENKVSEILSFFLDPNGSHNQGDIFLKLFLDKIGKSELNKEVDDVNIIREDTIIQNRRIDITINFSNFIIGIENKIYESTTDQINQIQDYADYLKQKKTDNYLLIYLAPKNKIISERSISEKNKIKLMEEKKLIQLNYEDDILGCIDSFIQVSESGRVTSFLIDFGKTLKKLLDIGDDFMDEKKVILDYAKQNNENLNLTLKIGNAVEELKKELDKEFENQLDELGKELKIEYNNKTEDKNWMSFIPKNWKNYKITFSFEQKGLIYGITRNEKDKNKNRNEEIENVLGGKWEVSSGFICWKFLYKYNNFEKNSNKFIKIKNKELKNEIKKLVEDMIIKLENYEM